MQGKNQLRACGSSSMNFMPRNVENIESDISSFNTIVPSHNEPKQANRLILHNPTLLKTKQGHQTKKSFAMSLLQCQKPRLDSRDQKSQEINLKHNQRSTTQSNSQPNKTNEELLSLKQMKSQNYTPVFSQMVSNSQFYRRNSHHLANMVSRTSGLCTFQQTPKKSFSPSKKQIGNTYGGPDVTAAASIYQVPNIQDMLSQILKLYQPKVQKLNKFDPDSIMKLKQVLRVDSVGEKNITMKGSSTSTKKKQENTCHVFNGNKLNGCVLPSSIHFNPKSKRQSSSNQPEQSLSLIDREISTRPNLGLILENLDQQRDTSRDISLKQSQIHRRSFQQFSPLNFGFKKNSMKEEIGSSAQQSFTLTHRKSLNSSFVTRGDSKHQKQIQQDSQNNVYLNLQEQMMTPLLTSKHNAQKFENTKPRSNQNAYPIPFTEKGNNKL